MRIAYFTNRYGSASYTFIMSEVEHLRRRGHQICTLSVRHPGSGEAVSEEVRREQRQTEYFFAAGAPHVAVLRILRSTLAATLRAPHRVAAALLLAQRTSAPGLRAWFRQMGYFALACHLAARMKALGIEHLHNHMATSSASIAMLAAVISGIPYSLTIHGGQIFWEPAQWALGEKIARSAFTACISDFCKSQCMLFSPEEAWDRLKIIRCVVDERFLSGSKAPLPADPLLVSVGRLSKEKGHLQLIGAVGRLAAEQVDVRLVLVGDGPMRSALERRIVDLGLEKRVCITGMLSPEDVRSQLEASRALVLPSLAEGLPLAVMEALARHRVVVASNVGAVAELVLPEETGWLVNPGSEEGLADAIRKVLQTPSDRLADMARRGAALVAARHGAQTEIAKLEELFEMASRRNRSSARSDAR